MSPIMKNFPREDRFGGGFQPATVSA